MRALIALLLVASLARAEEAPAPEAPEKPAPRILSEKDLVDDDGYTLRLSLPTVEDVAAWDEPGIRISLGYSYERFWGRAPAIFLTGHAFTLRALARLDPSWSVGLDFQYAAADGNFSGLRYASTAQALFHAWRGLSLGAGLGFGGLLLTPERRQPRPGDGEEIADVTFGPSVNLGECTGSAWVGLARAEYQFVVGPLFATGPFLELSSQYTRCERTLGRTDRETGNPIKGRQYWLHTGAALGWWMSWR